MLLKIGKGIIAIEYIISQIFGAIAVVLGFVTFQMRTQKKRLVV